MHHGREWTHSNKQLVNRGKLDFWIDLKSPWYATKLKKNGRPFTCADGSILAMRYLRFKFHLSLRELKGFLLSIFALSRRAKKVPCYTQVCRKMKALCLPAKLLEKKGVADIALDTTGLKSLWSGRMES